MENKKNKVEDYIFHPDLIIIAETNDRGKLNHFIKDHSQDETAIIEAFLLLQNLKVELADIPDEQVENDYDLLHTRINRQKKRRMVLWSAASVACVFLLVFSVFFTNSNTRMLESGDMYSMLDSMNVESTEIYVLSGNSQIQVEDNHAIRQTEEGNMIVGEKERLKSKDVKDEFLQLVVPKGKRTTLTFSDGTKVWVNSGTKLIYPKVFAKDKREVYVDGEIYIEVVKNADRPFLVKSKSLDISVLGTKFNVSTYSEDVEKSVVLLEGSVKVASNDIARTSILKPNQGFFYSADGASVKNVDAYAYICWKDNLMKLNGESLDVIFNKLARHYAVRFHVDKELMNEKYIGNLSLEDPIETVLQNLAFGTSFTYTKDGDNIYIKLE